VSQSEELDRLVRSAQAEHRLPSVSAAVVVRGETVYEQAIGVADAQTGRKASPDTQYRIGSITKTFTAAAVLGLCDEGKLSLDDPLGAHVPEAGDRPLTLRRMLAHLSGLQREPAGAVWETFEFPSVEELIEQLDDAEQVLQPGSHWHYSNLAYALLGRVVTSVCGRSCERFVEERLLAPLGLARTTWERVEPTARGYLVDPYSDHLRLEPDVPHIGGVAAAGDLWSTTSDLCRWGSWLAERDDMHQVQVMADTERWLLAWGLGLMLHRRGDRILYGHDGAMPGFLASLACSRGEAVTAAVLFNASTPPPAVTELAISLCERATELWPRPSALWAPTEPPPAEIAELLGSWWSHGIEFRFRWRGGRLESTGSSVRPWVKPAVFAPDGADRFRTADGPERGERLEVVRDAAGTAIKLSWATYALTREPRTFGDQRSPARK
jgi:CubicO group peptidase (beta-lactamase class C family)